jgi:glucose-6-phosphate 1-dehydrogenase
MIRDVMQNHLIQLLSLIAMDAPLSLQPDDISNEKIRVLKCIAPLDINNLVIGQYVRDKEGNHVGYRTKLLIRIQKGRHLQQQFSKLKMKGGVEQLLSLDVERL